MKAFQVIAVSALLLASANAQPAPSPPQSVPVSCIYNNRTFTLGSIICVGEKRGIQCRQDEATKIAIWFTDTNNNAPMNDGCKGPTPIN